MNKTTPDIDKVIEEATRVTVKDRSGWTRTAEATMVERNGLYSVDLVGPLFGCGWGTGLRRSRVDAIYAAYDFCDNDMIRITSWEMA